MFTAAQPLATYSVSEIRHAEERLFATQPDPDFIMRAAARQLATFLEYRFRTRWVQQNNGEASRILLLVGPGGNGGDALYAGSFLLEQGIPVQAFSWGDKLHQAAKWAYEAAGGTFLTVEEFHNLAADSWCCVVDGIFGIGGRAGLSGVAADLCELVQPLRGPGCEFVAVDIPSGMEADTGALGSRAFVCDFTVTFGGLRRAHAIAPECGQVIAADVIGAQGESLAEVLAAEAGESGNALVLVQALYSPGFLGVERHPWPQELALPGRGLAGFSVDPDVHDDKYSGGVVGICAGSAKYPGAAFLCCGGAVYATNSMVRYAGAIADRVVGRFPEIVATADMAQAGRVQAWVIGPGSDAAGELQAFLGQDTPLLIDADGITAVAQDRGLQELLRQRETVTVLTPHAGEFQRLVAGLGLEVDFTGDRVGVLRAVAEELHAWVLLKGRITLIASPAGAVLAVNTGNSRAATAGSGDVLAGICGAWLARTAVSELSVLEALHRGVVIHAVAAYLAGMSEFGPMPVVASALVDQVGRATAAVAQLNNNLDSTG